jgi:RNA polymerase sigma-70 factor (ECF subfamily)
MENAYVAQQDEAKFRRLIVPHFETAFNLAYWLTQNEADASDILQDASVKAFRFIDTLQSENSRAWFLQIIRNTSYSLLKSRKSYVEFDFEKDIQDETPNAEDALLENQNAKDLHKALDELPVPYREILILRELEELSYDEIAETLQIPEGTVMSRLARARDLLKKKLILQKGHQ